MRILRFRLYFQYSALQSRDQARLQVHTLLRPRWRGPRTRLHQGVSYRLSQVRHQRRHEIHRRGARETIARQLRLGERRRLLSALRCRNACDLRTPRRHRSRALRQPAEKSADPVELHGVEVAVQARAWHFRLVRLSRRPRALRDLRPSPDPTGTAGRGWRQCQYRRLDRRRARSNVSTTELARVSSTWVTPPSIAESCCDIPCTRACSTG